MNKPAMTLTSGQIGDAKGNPINGEEVLRNLLSSFSYLEGADKESKKLGGEEFRQASQQIGGLEASKQLIQMKNEILSELINQGQQQSQLQIESKPASSPLGFGGLEVQGNKVIEQKPGILASLISTVFTGTPNAGAAMDAARIAKLQKITGTEPIQPKEKMEQNVELLKQSITSSVTSINNLIGQENEISKDYTKQVEPLILAATSFQNIQSLYESSLKKPNGITDLGLVYELIKMYDPNAVREGEIANVKAAQKTVPMWMLVEYNRLFKGKNYILAPEVRNQILDTSKVKYKSIEDRFRNIKSQFENKVRAYGGNPERALINYSQSQKVGKYTVIQ